MLPSRTQVCSQWCRVANTAALPPAPARCLVEGAGGRLAGAVSFRHGAFGAGGAHRGGDINVKIDVHVPNGFVGSHQELAVALAKQVQPALLQLQRRNPLNQLSRSAVGWLSRSGTSPR